jgi:hypothetical protein
VGNKAFQETSALAAREKIGAIPTLRTPRGLVNTQGQQTAPRLSTQPASKNDPGTRSSGPVACVLFYVGVVLALLWQTLGLTRGHFVYAIDDAYIHLTLARNIAHGTYGINPGEFATPASSILWPFLLTLGSSASWHYLLPFFWNLIFGCAAAVLLGRIVNEWPWAQEGSGARAKRLLTCALIVIAGNLIGLAYVGMEHTLQVLLAIACAYGVVLALDDRPVPAWCIWAAILGPAVRYESFAITLALVIALLARKRRKAAIACGLASLVIPVAFGLVLMAHHHAPLPNSVLVKANVYNAPGGSNSVHLLTNVGFNLKMAGRNWSYLVLLAAALFVTFKARGLRAMILWGVTAALVLQLLIGRFGWFHRYEVYAVIFGTCVCFAALRDVGVRWIYVAAGLFLIGYPYLRGAMDVPFACLDVYRQQYQVARFVRDYYKQDVAVNDLGLSTYMSPSGAYVLDLIGLASDEARATGPRNPAALETMVARRKIGLVIAYPQYFKIPESWKLVGLLGEPRGETVTSAFNTIAFFVTPDGNAAQVHEELEQFAPTLPGGDTIGISDANESRPTPAPQGAPILGPKRHE